MITNKEHLATLPSTEWVMRVDWLYHSFGKAYTDSLAAIMDWLEEEYKVVKPSPSNLPNESWYYCPVCYTATIVNEPKCYKCCTDFDWSNVR